MNEVMHCDLLGFGSHCINALGLQTCCYIDHLCSKLPKVLLLGSEERERK